MKTKFILFFIGICFTKFEAQGLYLNTDDFVNHRLSYQRVIGKTYKFHVKENPNKVDFTIHLGDSVFHLFKDSVFGYADKHGVNYRFFKRNIFKIINPNEKLLLYSREHLGGYKGAQTITEYYFSKTVSGAIYKLTRHNLKQAFTGQNNFIDLIDLYFLNDADLIDFDSEAGIYKINSIFNKSQKK